MLTVGLFILAIVSFTNSQSVTTASGPYAPTGPFWPGQLIFEENFNEIDFEKWEHELTLSGGGNWEFQWYTNERQNSYIDNSTLHIAPTLVSDEFGEEFLWTGEVNLYGGAPADYCTNNDYYGCSRRGFGNNYINPIKSARLRTVKSFNFKYGVVEVRAKAPTGDWLWPAIWMLPKVNAYSGWPRSGEIDIMESRGNIRFLDGNDVNIGAEQVSSTLHFGPAWNMNGFEFATNSVNRDAGWNNDFHTYRLGWTEESIQFSVDDIIVNSINITEFGTFWELGRFDTRAPNAFNPWTRATNMAPFDQEFYLIINLAVGGTTGFFPDGLRNEFGDKPWSNTSPQAFKDFWDAKDDWLPTWGLGVDDRSHLQIDYVRIYAL